MDRSRAAGRLAPWPGLGAALVGGPAGQIRAWARRRPDQLALAGPEGRWTWAALDRALDRAARFWAARGVCEGQTLGVLTGNRAEALIHPLALTRLGARAALLDPRLRGEALAHCLRAAQIQGLLVDPAGLLALDSLLTLDRLAAPRLPLGAWGCGGVERADIPASEPLLAQIPDRPVSAALTRGDQPFCYLFTSGTTGHPKAAPISFRRLLLPGLAFQHLALRLGPHDTLFTPLPLHHASAWIVGLSSALAAGAGFAWAAQFKASRYWQDAAAVGATVGIYVGELCRYLVAQPPRPEDPHHRLHTFIGNGLTAETWRRFQARFGGPRIIEFYGATEGNALLINRDGTPGACGRPVLPGPLDGLRLVRHDPATEAPARDPTGRLIPCAPDEPGELIGRIGRLPSEHFDGYLDPEATAAKILRDAFRPGDAWYRTGDLLRRAPTGDYTFVDRIGDTFRWKGENISAQTVTDALRGIAGVRDLAVFGVRLPGCEGRAGMAAVVADALDPEALYAAAQARLIPAARPALIRQVADLERTATLKLKRATLKAQNYTDCGADPLWIRDDAAGRYVPFDAAAKAALAAGRWRL